MVLKINICKQYLFIIFYYIISVHLWKAVVFKPTYSYDYIFFNYFKLSKTIKSLEWLSIGIYFYNLSSLNFEYSTYPCLRKYITVSLLRKCIDFLLYFYLFKCSLSEITDRPGFLVILEQKPNYFCSFMVGVANLWHACQK